MPDMPAPMITTWNGLSGLTSSLCQRGARRSAVSASSSRIIGRYSSISSPPAMNSRIWRRSGPVGIGATTLPPSRNAISVSSASARIAVLLLGRQAALVLAHQQRVDAQLGAQQRQVAGDVGERRQQRRQVGDLERGAQLVVGGGDRLDRVGRGPWSCPPAVRRRGSAASAGRCRWPLAR